MAEAPGVPARSGRRSVRMAGVVVVLAAAAVFLGPRLYRKFEEPPLVDVADVLRGEYEGEVVMVRGVVMPDRAEQGHIFLRDIDERGEIVVDGISMLPVVKVQSWAWFDAGQEVRLPVLISADAAGNLLLIEIRRRGQAGCRLNIQGGEQAPGEADSAQVGR